MRRIIFLSILFLSIVLCDYSQPWMKDIPVLKSTDDSTTFFQIEKAFYDYWQGKKIEKGKGYKPFMRWLEFMKPRVYPYGKLPITSLLEETNKKSLLKSTTATNPSWKFLGPDATPTILNSTNKSGSGRLNCVAFHPANSNIIYVGAPSGGIWKTINGGNSWSSATDQLPSIGISDIVIDHQNPNIVYAATGDGDGIDTYGIGIIKSINGGITWINTSLTQEITDYNYFRKIIMHPDNPQIMIATSKNGIYRTSNGWNTYTLIINGNFKDIDFNPGNPNIVYATLYSANGYAKIYKSVNNGISFNISMTGLSINGFVNRIELAVTPANPSLVYAVASDANNDGLYGVYKSTDNGTNWIQIYGNNAKNLLGWNSDGSDIGGQGFYDLAIEADPANESIVYIGGVNIWKTTNGGSIWRLTGLWYHGGIASYIHADHHMLKFNPLNNELFSANDGGLHKSNNGGRNWINLSNGLKILQIYRLSSSYSNKNVIIAGSQDNGTMLVDSLTWNEILGGDGMECFIDPVYDSILYGTIYRGDLFKSYNRAKKFTNIKPDNSGEGAWITPFFMHPHIPTILYSGYTDVYKSINSGLTWEKISDNLTNEVKLISIEVAPSDDNYIYASTSHNIWKTGDGGTSWIEITDGLPNYSITDIVVSENDPQKIWISLASYSPTQKVYSSSDAGNKWTKYSDGLPNIPITCLLYEKNTNKALYAGTDLGVYYRDASMASWEDFSVDLPNVIVYDMDIHYPTNTIRAGTYGRGLWYNDLHTKIDTIFADFVADITNACKNSPVTFTYKGSENFDSIRWNFGPYATPFDTNGPGPVTVSFDSLRKESVSVTVYKNGFSSSEIKNDYINVVEEIDFIVSPEAVAGITGRSEYIYVTENYNYTWSPSAYLDQETGNVVQLLSGIRATITVTGVHGACTKEKQIKITLSPDNACDADDVEVGLNGPYTNFFATYEVNEPVPPKGSDLFGCNSQDGWCIGELEIENSVWFRFIVPYNGNYSIEFPGFDNQVAVYKANVCNDLFTDNYTLLAANDDFPNKLDYSAIIAHLYDLSENDTLWIQVDGSQDGMMGYFYLKINPFVINNTKKPVINKFENGYISIYPNPNYGDFTLQLKEIIKGTYFVKIYNINGQKVFEKEYHFNTENINIEHLEKGMYFLEVVNNKQKSIHKIILQ